MTALLLLMPQTPMLFQGQEFAASSPFLYFNDCQGAQAKEVARGRAKFLVAIPLLRAPRDRNRDLPEPCRSGSFQRCKLDFGERERHAASLRVASRPDSIAARRSRIAATRRDTNSRRYVRTRRLLAAIPRCRRRDAAVDRQFRPRFDSRLDFATADCSAPRHSLEYAMVERRPAVRRHRNAGGRHSARLANSGRNRRAAVPRVPRVSGPGVVVPGVNHRCSCPPFIELPGRWPSAAIRRNCCVANGSSPTASAAMLPARCRESARAAITACSSPRCNPRSAG